MKIESIHKSRPHTVKKEKLPAKYPYSSMWLCNITKEIEEIKNRKKDDFEVHIEKNGLRIVTYLTKREKYKAIPTKEERMYYDYFEHHRDCKETFLYTKDITHPKLLRHYSKEKEKEFPIPEQKIEILNLSDALRLRNKVRKTKK